MKTTQSTVKPVIPPMPIGETAPPLKQQVEQAMRRALSNLSALQEERGSWAGDYGGPMFLLPMYVALAHATGMEIPAHRKARMGETFFNAQRPDGSIGLHSESTEGSMFCTALGYVALRILGQSKDEPRVTAMRRWIADNGTPLGAASWGKFTLCLLGLYDWKGIHAVQPELWLLPRSAPMHPGNLWCHCRQVYLPMAWLYARRATAPHDRLIFELRDELYGGQWPLIDWEKNKDATCGADDYRPVTAAMRAVNASLDAAEKLPFKPLRKRAMDEVYEHILYEDRVTNFIDIGPVNKVLNTFVHHFHTPRGENFKKAWAACEVYLWDGHDGMKMQGYNNSEFWDTVFTMQAIASTPFARESGVERMMESAYAFLRDNQILEDVPEHEKYFRHPCKGGWPFSNRPHGWPITDCTSEGLRVSVALEGRYSPEVPTDMLRESVKLILSWQNEDGGWATYEKTRGPAWLEQLNPSQVFGDIMIDYSHVECTSACIQGLVVGRKRFPGEFDEVIEKAIERGIAFLNKAQRPDGSFEGAWAVCFTYGTWFGVTGMLAAGIPASDERIVRACRYLLAQQRADGAWGEAGDSSRERKWIQAADGQAAQTGWALSTLVRAGCKDTEAMARGAAWLVSRQEADGSWPREGLVGVFNRTCLINYDNYRHYFPLWALGEWHAAQSKVASPAA